MLIYPAIDLRGGKCVRLRQGDFSQETVFGEDPVVVARKWVDLGATFLHLVDLDGARMGHPVHTALVGEMVRAAGVPCQLGGGLRQEEHLRAVLEVGVARVILGTRALQDPDWAMAMCRTFPGKVALGIDARDSKVATEGWLHKSDLSAIDLARSFADAGPAAIIYTDIAKDGMLEGPAVEPTANLARAVPTIPVIASGGVTSLEDIACLARAGIPGCIIGRSLYEGRLDLAKALALSQQLAQSS
ncbi:MAG: 1-(5-phosphoribosyl)-5-[(5-phosphoribosylamino)methylideneamino]imidazole-4-carboxamide isomerase [Gemmataceae bacterium]